MTEGTLLDTTLASDGALIEDLARRVEEASGPTSYDLDDSTHIIARVTRTDERLTTTNLEKWLGEPIRARGSALLHDPGDFVSYCNRLGSSYTTVWGNQERATFTAVFNDHITDTDTGWRDHTATLALQDDKDWAAFLERDGKYLTQVQFAEFLLDYQPLFVDPDGATLLEIATHFKAHKKAEYSSEVDLDTGDVQFNYTEITTQKTQRAGQIELPRELTVELSPYLGMEPVRMLARLRWNVEGGALSIGIKLQRPDLVKRDAFEGVRRTILDGVNEAGISVLLGVAPGPVTPQS